MKLQMLPEEAILKPAVQSLRVQGQSGGYAQREEKQGFV